MRCQQISFFDSARYFKICGIVRRHSWANSARPAPPICTRTLRFLGTSIGCVAGSFSFHWKTRSSLFCRYGNAFCAFPRGPSFSSRRFDSHGWPILRGGAQALPDALAQHLEDLGGRIEINHEITQLPEADLILAAITPRQLLRIAGSQLPSRYCRRLERFRYGAGAFKIDYALSAPIPWAAAECSRAATVHIGGTLEEIAESEQTFTSDRPFVLLGQPSLFDPSRAPVDRHTAWAYCHVPNGSAEEYTESIERQITRFAPDFRDCILARSISSPAALEKWNPNLIGGDFVGGAMDFRQLLFRPTPSLYRTPRSNLYLCGASPPPGGGVHGMAGYHAAMTALAHLTR